ncbi:hypothetical protein O181_025600 [Austropuccinia psidii MF-1]|uniref:Uncharacterized protein n=1 Tax=Austropuccinia psidii MF-1 TaxID=1389203 RepID=A0A9Q3CMS3_9BASI|nr:hypothetical protein [Austropuccinia psidii MF-1]
MENITRKCCAHAMEYKNHKGYTHDWVTHIPSIQLAYNNSQNSNTGKSPSLEEKWLNHSLPVDHLKKNLQNIHPTAKGFHDLWKRACDTDARLTDEEK